MYNSTFNKYSGLLAGMSVVIIWSGWIVISKWGINNNLTIWDITGIRFLTAGILITPYWYLYRQKIQNIFSIKVFIYSTTCGTVYLVTSLIGLKYANTSNVAVVVNGTLPVMCSFILYIWKRNILSKFQYLGIIMILISNYILITVDTKSTTLSFVWFLLSSLSLAFYSVSIKIWDIKIKTILVSVPIINSLIYTPIWLFFPSNISIASWQEVALQIVYQGVIVSIIALFLMAHSINKLGSVGASTILALVPIVSSIFVYIFLREQIPYLTWVSIFICAAGIACYSSIDNNHKKNKFIYRS